MDKFDKALDKHIQDPDMSGNPQRDSEEFQTTCKYGKPHTPDGTFTKPTKCKECGQIINITGMDSGYWFTEKDFIEWDKLYGGE